ncbi:MAG: type IV secretion system DNA-binding domain-containing protein [Elusimicrobiota bacterium]
MQLNTVIPWLINHYSRLPTVVHITVFLVCFIYVFHFFVYYILKPARPKIAFIQFVIYLCLVYFAYYFNKYVFPVNHTKYFGNATITNLYDIIFHPLYYYLSAISFILSFLILILSPVLKSTKLTGLLKKYAKYSPVFTPLTGTGIVVGSYNRNILHETIRYFAPDYMSGVVVPYNRLARTTTIIGDMGTGKSRLMRIIHDGLIKQYPNIPILIHDPKGEWLRTYYNPGTDLIFAPYDTRSCKWSLWDDFKKYPQLLHALVSTAIENYHTGSGGSDRFWADSAISLLKNTISSSDTILNAKQKLMELKSVNKDDRTFLSIYTSAMIALKDIAAIELFSPSGTGGKTYSITDFLKHRGRIFLLNNPVCSAEQHGTLSLMLTAFILHAISQPDVSDEDKINFSAFIDEALTFKLPKDVETAVFSQCRSKGLALIVSAQRIPDPQRREYSGWSWQSTNFFLMRVTDLYTRQNFSERAGKILYDDTHKSYTTSSRKLLDLPTNQSTSSMNEKQRQVLLPEDVGRLKNREFVLFHEHGISPGKVKDVLGGQSDIPTLDYHHRTDVNEFMDGL